MSHVKIEPLSQADLSLMAALMDEEQQAWLRELDWDYAPIRRILESFLRQRLLPGFVLTNGASILGYSYFLVSQFKGVIGTLYASPEQAQQAAESILRRTIESLKAIRNVRRIEAQILPLNGLNLDPVFAEHGFRSFPRHYLELDLAARERQEPERSRVIVPWNSGHLLPAAGVACRSYRKGIDALICADYGSEASCAAYLRSVVDNPGCGVFLPESSFVAVDSRGAPCGFILSSRISNTAAMIPQIAIHPAHQGKGSGNTLMRRALSSLQSAGFRTVRLTVTEQNRRAFDWYQRLGFKMRRDFGAYLWQGE